MKVFNAPAIVAATLISGVAADFVLYAHQELDAAIYGDQSTRFEIFAYDGEPSCDDYHHASGVMVVGDASSPSYARCKGCEGAWKDWADWDVEELEINVSDWDHLTIYKERDYNIESLNGHTGQCTRVTDDDYYCTTGFTTGQGYKLFNCKSDLGGIHAKGYRVVRQAPALW